MNDRLPRIVGLGIMAAAAVLILAPAVAAAARPAARRGIKAAVKAFARGREVIAEVQETVEDAYAEAVAELREEENGAADSAPAAPADERRRTRHRGDEDRERA